MKKIASVLAVVVLLGAGCANNTNQNIPTYGTNVQESTTIPSVSSTPTGSTADSTDGGEPTYTMAQVAAANSEAKCWSAINGKVYNLTAWINQHPGGDRNILKICGKDGTAAFTGQHGGQMQPEKVLAGFKIGTLK